MALNDPHWGRGRGEPEQNEDARHEANRPPADDDTTPSEKPKSPKNQPRQPQQEEFGDDIEALWEKITGILGGQDGQAKGRRRKPQLKGRDDFSRDDLEEDAEAWRVDDRQDPLGETRQRMRVQLGSLDKVPGFNFTPRLVGGLAIVLLGIWGASGFYIVPEGQEGVVTTFGQYTQTTTAGFRWHIPEPVQSVTLVDVSRVRTTEIGAPGRADRLREALMLTDDENIVDLQFTVQYRIKPGQAQNYVFNLRDPETTVQQVAESAMREVVGRKTMDSVLFESKAEIANAVRQTMQQTLDHYKSGIEIMSVAIQNAQPPEPVQAAFNDAVKAGQDRERAINLGQAYYNAVIPKAQGAADRLREEAQGYAARVVESATGEAQRFKDLVAQYKADPQVTRDRLYIDAMRDIYTKSTKVLVDTKNANPLLYLPFDKLVDQVKQDAQNNAQSAANVVDEPTGSTSPRSVVTQDSDITRTLRPPRL